jgi:hypothetical protein
VAGSEEVPLICNNIQQTVTKPESVCMIASPASPKRRIVQKKKMVTTEMSLLERLLH